MKENMVTASAAMKLYMGDKDPFKRPLESKTKAREILDMIEGINPGKYFNMGKLKKVAQNAYDEVVKDFDRYSDLGDDIASYVIDTIVGGAAGIHQPGSIIRDFEISVDFNTEDKEKIDSPDNWDDFINPFFSHLSVALEKKIKLKTIDGYSDYRFGADRNKADGSYDLFIYVEKD